MEGRRYLLVAFFPPKDIGKSTTYFISATLSTSVTTAAHIDSGSE